MKFLEDIQTILGKRFLGSTFNQETGTLKIAVRDIIDYDEIQKIQKILLKNGFQIFAIIAGNRSVIFISCIPAEGI